MSKLPNASRESMTPVQQEIWDKVHEGKTGGGGPYSMLMHSPEMAQYFAATEDYFRNNSLLSDADRETIILTAAREVEAHYAWSRHEIRAKQCLPGEVIEALRGRAPVDKFTGRTALLVEFTRALMRDHYLSDELFSRMEKEFGCAKFIECVGLLGHYITIGTVIRMFDVRPAAGTKTF